jgi:hypothetical protein
VKVEKNISHVHVLGQWRIGGFVDERNSSWAPLFLLAIVARLSLLMRRTCSLIELASSACCGRVTMSPA